MFFARKVEGTSYIVSSTCFCGDWVGDAIRSSSSQSDQAHGDEQAGNEGCSGKTSRKSAAAIQFEVSAIDSLGSILSSCWWCEDWEERYGKEAKEETSHDEVLAVS